MRRALAALALALWPAVAAGASLTLDAKGQQEAVRVGEKSVSNDAFDAEWRVENATGDSLSVLTPFHRLVVGDREIKAAFVQNERTAHRQENGRYLARCVYGFPTRDLDGRAKASLIVEDSAGRDVSTFAIHLGTMR